MRTIWSPAMMERLRALVIAGTHYSLIAEMMSAEFNLHLTKNSCIGKGRRLRVPLRLAPRKRACRKRNAQSGVRLRKPLPSVRRSQPNPRKRKLKASPLRLRKRQAQLPRQRDLTLLALLPTSCRWPSGDPPNITFCGDRKVDGSAYCLKHARIASPSFGRAR